MSSPSPAYLAALEASKEIHKGKQFTGKFLRPHAPFIKEIIDRLGCKTVLDYGCGKGQQYEWVMPNAGTTIEQYWGVAVTKYDPACAPFAKEPVGKFDMVICTQVLGAIPVSDIEWVVNRLYSLSKKALYISERLHTPRKLIADNSLRPAWKANEWKAELTRTEVVDGKIELTLALREINKRDEKITNHYRLIGREWQNVVWPEGVRGMNHTWA